MTDELQKQFHDVDEAEQTGKIMMTGQQTLKKGGW